MAREPLWIRLRRYYQVWKDFKQSLKARHTMLYVAADIVETLLIALVLALIIRKFVIQTSVVPTGSMIPTLNIGDRLFVSKFVYRFREPRVGEIVVFKAPHGEKKDYVKRCVAVSGQTIEIENGVVFVDGAVLRLPGVVILRDFSQMAPTRIPEGHYFMMGDNRGNSLDSRAWGLVTRKALLGKALFTFWPLSQMEPLR